MNYLKNIILYMPPIPEGWPSDAFAWGMFVGHAKASSIMVYVLLMFLIFK